MEEGPSEEQLERIYGLKDKILRDRSKAFKNICYIKFPIEKYSTWEEVLGEEENKM